MPSKAVDAGVPIAPTVFTRGKIAVGMGYGCVVAKGATLMCWGRSFPDKPTAISVANVVAVAAAQATTCALTAEGAVYCMSATAPIRIAGIDDAVELATDPDTFTMCARRKSGTVACWSDFSKGKIEELAGISGALEIAVAGGTPCVRDAKGVVCVSNEGPKRIANTESATRLGSGHFTFGVIRRDQPPIAWHEDGKPFPLPALNADIQQIAFGSDTACALGHTVQCWDTNNHGTPYEIPAAGAGEIAVGYALSCARFSDHAACWGVAGELGEGTPAFSDEPSLVANLTDATQIAIGNNQTCALRADKRVVCWGTTTNTDTDPVPTEYPNNKSWFTRHRREWGGSHFRASWDCAEKKGHIKCTTSFQERGDGGVSTGDETSWGSLDGARDLRLPTNALEDVCVANAAGVVTCFSSDGPEGEPRPLAGLADVIQLVAYGEKTCALERAGTVKCWKDSESIKPIAGIHDAVELAAGDIHACVRHKTGTVSCWGDRSLLGDGRDSHQRVPLTLSGVSL